MRTFKSAKKRAKKSAFTNKSAQKSTLKSTFGSSEPICLNCDFSLSQHLDGCITNTYVDGLFLCSEEGKTAILILPIVALEPQVEVDMARLGLRFVSLTCSHVESLEELIRVTKPHVLIGNVESLTSPAIQRRISKLR